MYNRVMVIDDNAIDRYIAEVSIIKHQFAAEVITKESAVDALDYLTLNATQPTNLPTIIFLDINMPEVNGFEFMEAFEKLPPAIHQACDVIMLSSSIDPEDHKNVTENRFVKLFLSKPLNKEKLKELLVGYQKSAALA